jgi:hypothetical protein
MVQSNLAILICHIKSVDTKGVAAAGTIGGLSL